MIYLLTSDIYLNIVYISGHTLERIQTAKNWLSPVYDSIE